MPTLPSINKNDDKMKSTSEEIPVQNYANDCQSTSLPLVNFLSSIFLRFKKLLLFCFDSVFFQIVPRSVVV